MLETLKKLEQYWWSALDEAGDYIPLTEVNQLNALGESPIHIAAWKGSAEDVRWLLAHGADINQRGDFQMTPLHYAYMSGKRENIEALLAAGADPALRCDRGLLPHDGRPEK